MGKTLRIGGRRTCSLHALSHVIMHVLMCMQKLFCIFAILGISIIRHMRHREIQSASPLMQHSLLCHVVCKKHGWSLKVPPTNQVVAQKWFCFTMTPRTYCCKTGDGVAEETHSNCISAAAPPHVLLA